MITFKQYTQSNVMERYSVTISDSTLQTNTATMTVTTPVQTYSTRVFGLK